MNQIDEEIQLHEYMTSDDGHGREQGIELLQKLISFINASNSLIYRISLRGVRRLDASFPRESIMEIARSLKGEKGFCLTNVSNIDLIDNLDAAALKKNISMVIWKGDEHQMIGVEPKKGVQKVLDFALRKEMVTAAEVCEQLELKLNNASMKLKQLASEGYLIRQEEIAPSGGKEFYYYRIK